MGSLVRMLAVSIHSGCLVLVEGEEGRENMREEFEAAVKLAFHQAGNVADLTKVRGQYVEDVHQSAWWAWQASRTSIEVDLPDWFDPYGGSGEQAYWRIEVDRAIKSLGLKVKS